jgi:uncharacterized membrane protein
MAQRPDGRAAKTRAAAFTRPAAERIARVVRRVESGSRDEAPLRFQRVGVGSSSAGLRHAEWSSQWAAAETATFTFKSNNVTATGVNVFAGVAAGSGWVANHSGTWHLVVCNLTTQPDYSSSDVQMLGHDDEGILRWYTTVACDEEESEE